MPVARDLSAGFRPDSELTEPARRRRFTGEHTIWPWVSYLASILAAAYEDFEQRVGVARDGVGSKQDRVREYIVPTSASRIQAPGYRAGARRSQHGNDPPHAHELRDSNGIRAEGSRPRARWRRLDTPASS